jgi:hypothetical protein
MSRAICADSADSAPGHTSCKRQVSGSNPLTGFQADDGSSRVCSTSRFGAADRLQDMDTTTDVKLLVRAISPARLDAVYSTGSDGHGNRVRPFAATGQGEPLRCCLRFAEPGEDITLISYAPFDHPSVWTEVGPVYIHATRCDGYQQAGRLPGQLATGPRVLRTYRADDTMNYDHNTVVTDDADLEPIIQRLLREPDVASVHVRSLAPQCFLYTVAAVDRPRADR